MQISKKQVTILILIDGFLQFARIELKGEIKMSHNPYFNRWFSAIHIDILMEQTPIKSQSLF